MDNIDNTAANYARTDPRRARRWAYRHCRMIRKAIKAGECVNENRKTTALLVEMVRSPLFQRRVPISKTTGATP